ncbi:MULTISPECIES: nucleotidyltransferase-like protein [Geobacillus]|jgi:hypothetical protein|uniref:Nucleotidyltransferase-like domain-containing protein n=2 Tax=Geobacillus thermodenitrificans TaxID=33940 RepID=A4IKM0_GEOTN|nr:MULTISPECIES: nucleotidyltransferase-like protein [Geobacillus]ABO65874.1 Conserved hypothetical protein [Geobacillus thermodenitrificans NG80-2]ARA97687.1 hypothetical protein GD3902_06245 [Geobacillus thermodenitrificans]ARP41599.1 hypothetical protein GTHT12_00010 [Geobacillus thermodenitrificans]ATO37015.1 hypothetical protein GTID1_07150 [Geobacillus thermodenitrificans]MED4919164.1 nucleotidyltransferase-like protein [Geobacillus thermodenitrificans]
MEELLRPIYQEWASRCNTLGILLIEKNEGHETVTDTFDALLLVIVDLQSEPLFLKHYSINGEKAALYAVNEQKLNEWFVLGSHRKAVDWVFNGKIVFDRNDYVWQLRQRLEQFPPRERQLKMGLEFAKLIRRYTDGKALFSARHWLDSYNHMMHALHHLARLTVIEHGLYPEVTVWNQVKQMDGQIYKLYEELVGSEEPLPKRLELLLLASEFLIHSFVAPGSSHLCEVLKQKEGAWSIEEMTHHPQFAPYSVDLTIMLEYLVERKVLSAVEVPTNGEKMFERYYTLQEEKN